MRVKSERQNQNWSINIGKTSNNEVTTKRRFMFEFLLEQKEALALRRSHSTIGKTATFSRMLVTSRTPLCF